MVVRLTPAGAREAAAAAAWPDYLLEAVDELSGAEQAAFLRGLVTMIRTLQVMGRIPVARMCVSCEFFRPFRHDDPAAPHHCAVVDAPFGDGELRLDCPRPPRRPGRAGRAGLARLPRPDRPEEGPMSQSDIPGYTYGAAAVPRSPVGVQELELPRATLLLGDDDLAALRRFGRWILDTARAGYDQAWLDDQHAIGLRHTRRRAVLLPVILRSRPCVRDGDF